MKKLIYLLCLFNADILQAQDSTGTLKKKQIKANADDPSQFFTRIEVFNELQHYDKDGNDFYLNQTVLRTIVKIGKRFTTRADLPYVHNSINTATSYQQSGIGDISFRLLGYKFFERPKTAFTASVEVSLNTSQSRLLGTGKNLLIPVLSYTKIIPQKKMVLSLVFQQAGAVSGDKARKNISFSKLQFLFIKIVSKRSWIVLAPEWFFDYVRGGLSMNMRSRFTYALTPRINIWATPGAGVFGDFAGRYQWSGDIGARYFLFKGIDYKNGK